MSRCYMDIRFGRKSLGRLVFELDDANAPRTSHNFRMLCSGEEGFSKKTRKALHYRGHPFHRVIPGFMIQGGDITAGDGTGGESIYGPKFKDEYLKGRHNQRGLLSMANSGPHTNGSQFFITFAKAAHLDGKHVVFGKIVEGMSILDRLESVSTSNDDRPRTDVVIEECGIVDEPQKQTAVEEEVVEEAVEEEEEERPDFSKMSARQKRLFDLRMKMNHARKMNKKETVQEHRRMTETPAQKRYREQREYMESQKQQQNGGDKGKVDKDDEQYLLNEPATAVLERHRKKDKKRPAAEGWSAFNDDSLYRAYKKRTAAVPVSTVPESESDEKISEVSYGGIGTDSKAGIDAMVAELEETHERRTKFKRRRQYYEDETVSFINERNRVFNKKASRFFDEYTAQIKANIEKGTA